ncbi:cytochrome P450 [Artemisia annua]|uniref:Cytochrome P450 n=1 Tax=Artemisia annua TaxID=35608 RepID=A0A2U1N751_ARTAN|nr:cytochrome P450 [Artemisia annua]
MQYMDYPTFFLVLSFFLTFIYAFTISRSRNSRLPPGPYPLPIIGNLLKLSNKPHRSLATLSKHYGPIMSLKLGSRTTIVVSSPDMAKEFFHTHDQAFSSRTVPHIARWMDHHKYSIGWLPAGDQWRKLRRITKEYIFSGQCLDRSEQLRTQKVQELVDHISQCCASEKAVNIGAAMFTTSLNILSNIMFSKDFSQSFSMSSEEFKDAMWGIMEIGGKPNLVDFFPILKFLDPQGLERQGNIYGKKIFTIFDEIIDQRFQRIATSSTLPTINDALDLMINLQLKDESEFNRKDIRHLLLDLFVAGTDTTSTTLEWAMVELIRNPEKIKMARLEIIRLMQSKENLVQENDIPQLPYLQAIIKETLRLHPPAPFLIPHQAIHDVEVRGFLVPKDSQILCNVWAIGRDPKIWSDPETFMPERFLGVDIDYRGQDFELIPFGAGRRMCPGFNMAHRMLPIILSSVIHKFDWKLQENMRVEDMDMDEKFGLTCPRNEPLLVVPIKL